MMNYNKIGNKYTLDKKLGEGTFSITYLARDEAGHKVAVKHIQKRKVKEEDWENEINILRILQKNPHPNIVTCLDIFEDESDVFIIEELLPHGDLLTFVTRNSPLREADIRRLFWTIINAVEHLHSLGIVHRDIKLENLLLDSRGRVKLIDFNLSSLYSDKTFLSRFCGSLPYCPPEMVLRTPYVGPEVDVWALGVLFYLFLFARYPFPVDDERDINCLRKFMTNLLNAQFTLPTYHPYTSEAINLLRSFFKTDRTKRPSLEVIKSHPWFRIMREEEKRRNPYHQQQNIKNSQQTTTNTTTTNSTTNEILSKMENLSVTTHRTTTTNTTTTENEKTTLRVCEETETSERYTVWKPFLKNGIFV